MQLGQLVRHPRVGLAVIILIYQSRKHAARRYNLREFGVINVNPMPDKVLWQTGCETHFTPATEAELAEVGQSRVDELYRIGIERVEAEKRQKVQRRENKINTRRAAVQEQRLSPGARVLIRGPKGADWEARVLKVNAIGRIQVLGESCISPQWCAANAVICCLDPLTVELPCTLSENTLDQLQERGWSQFQIGKGLQRQAYIVAFAPDDVATKGDNPSRAVNFDPGLGLHWRLD